MAVPVSSPAATLRADAGKSARETIATVTTIGFIFFSLSQRLERRPQLGREDLRLLPRREVAALADLVVIDEFWIRPLCPAPRRLIEFIRKRGDGHRNGDAFRGEKDELAFPIE